MKYTETQLYQDFRADVAKRIVEYDHLPNVVKTNGFAALALADSITELAIANAPGLVEIKDNE